MVRNIQGYHKSIQESGNDQENIRRRDQTQEKWSDTNYAGNIRKYVKIILTDNKIILGNRLQEK